MYKEDPPTTTEFEDDETPMGGPSIDTLAQTGGIPAEVFYVLGGVCILGAILLLSKKTKTNE